MVPVLTNYYTLQAINGTCLDSLPVAGGGVTCAVPTATAATYGVCPPRQLSTASSTQKAASIWLLLLVTLTYLEIS